MGGLSSAIDWWDEWKLRILVLCSLFVHFFLFFAGHMRPLYALRRLRVLVWLAYMGSDALAVYALATLFNRQKQQLSQTAADGGGGGSSALEVLWAPVLLIHLGGQPSMTAYSLEDNELWKRHAITVVSQVTVALYVFCKWWSGQKRLLHAAIFLFIDGILKFSQKPWALQRPSMMSAYLSSLPRRAEEESGSLWRRVGKIFIAVCTCTDFRDIQAQLKGKPGGGVGEKGINYSLEEYVNKTLAHVKGSVEAPRVVDARKKLNSYQAHKDIYRMFLGLAAPYSVRLDFLQTFLNLDGQNQHNVLWQCIYHQFVAIYTNERLTTCLGACTLFVLPSLPLASVVLFAKSDKDGYDKSDITVTYILFFGTVVMESAVVLVPILWKSLIGCKLVRNQPVWQHDMVSQHNIMSFCVRKKKPPTLMKISPFSYLRDYINKHWYIWHENRAHCILMLVRHHAEEHGWKECIRDAATYRRFNQLKGEYTLMKRSHHLMEKGKLGWTFNLPFDEYVLLWHLATDLCFHQPTDDNASASTSQASVSSRHHHHPNAASYSGDHHPIPIPSRDNSVIISNYMIYLLFICPEMLIPGARQDLFILACDDIEHIIKNQSLPSLDEGSIARRVLCMGQDGDESMISKAYKLAKALTDLNNNMEMWQVIQGVWVEMLCYSASRCRGYLHAKSLGLGGEFLTHVWLLWWFMGMQTLPDMMNNLGPPEELTAPASV